jgi:hypothetical protein
MYVSFGFSSWQLEIILQDGGGEVKVEIANKVLKKIEFEIALLLARFFLGYILISGGKGDRTSVLSLEMHGCCLVSLPS